MTEDVGSAGMTEVGSQSARHIVEYLDSTREGGLQALKRLTFDLLEPKVGDHILDVGCGTGDDVLTLAGLVGEKGRVLGIDTNKLLLAEARNRAATSAHNVEFVASDVHHLGFDSESFDGVRAERVFMHLNNPKQALLEMARVTKTEGQLVVAEPDWETWVIDVPERSLTRKIQHYAVDTYVRNGWMGRQLYALSKTCGLENIEIIPLTLVHRDFAQASTTFAFSTHADRARSACVISGGEAKTWLDQMRDAASKACFFAALTFFVLSAKKRG